MTNKHIRIEQYTLLLSTILYFAIACINYLGRDFSSGDESLFILDLSYIKEFGWIEAIKKGISIPYMILAYPLSLFLKNYLALRSTNLILLAIFFLYLSYKKRVALNQFAYIFFYFSSAAFFFFGSNDTLFVLCLAGFLIECHFVTSTKNFNPTIAISTLIICIFTRELFIVYLPIIVLGLIIIVRKTEKLSKNILIPLTILITLFTLNLPSLNYQNQLSYDRKDPPKKIEASWTQRQYLAQKWVSEGRLKDFNHPTWKQTEQYLKLQGKNSLPDGVINGLLFDFKVTITEFIKDLIYIFIYHTRTVSLMLLSGLMLFIKHLVNKKRTILQNFIPLSTIIMIMIFALIIISFVELRWLAPVFLASIIYYAHMERIKEIPSVISKLNLYILFILSVYGIVGLLDNISV